MESPNSTEPDKPIEPAVQTAPAVDTSQLFQKDPELVVSSTNKNPLARLGKKKQLILVLLLVFVIIGGGLAFAQFNKPNKQSSTQQAAEEKAGNTTSTASNDSTTDSTTDQTATNDSSTPSSTSTSPSGGSTGTTSNTSSGGSTSTNGGGSGGSSGGSGATTTSPKTYDISYTNNCYSPANVTIKKGDTIKFTNNSTTSMWPASNDHPNHTIYSEFDSKKPIKKGASYSFTFIKTGSWGYHDHLEDSCGGTITVQ